ncbi:MAG: CREG family protein [Roseiflexus sp.]|nr:CREG family protein [Roseiflexus sp.]MCS7291034.1 CREG family protein [Roseiflexus sp.]MDW8234226.1 pyridoxamine 5'-phosphate oxidase family protein [Roseiflexaceae bacterium]
MLQDELPLVARLLRSQRVASLGTLADGVPFVSLVAYVVEDDLCSYLLHLSDLSPHTRHLRADPRAALLIAEPETAEVEDVQTLARITLSGTVAQVGKNSPEYTTGRERYLARHPAAAMLFDFADFNLYRFTASSARYVGGFARAYTLTVDHLRQAAAGTIPQ